MLIEKNNIISFLISISFFLSCSCITGSKSRPDEYLNLVKANKLEIKEVGNYIILKNYHEDFSKYRITKNVEDPIIKDFYKKYKLMPFIYSYPANFKASDTSSYEQIKDSALVFVKPRKGLFRSQYDIIISYKKEFKALKTSFLNVHKIDDGLYISKY